MSDQPREACGVFGIYAPGEDVARLTFFGLYALQHRGQESAGIATNAPPSRAVHCHAGMGLVSQAFHDEVTLARLRGDIAIGHTRYSTTGASRIANAQPILVESDLGPVAVGHNGNLINAAELRAELAERGVSFHSSTDSEVLAQVIAAAPGTTWPEKLQSALPRLRGAFSLVILTPGALWGVRDSLGVRPLALGRFGTGWVLASESCALDHIGAESAREVRAGEIVQIDADGVRSHRGLPVEREALCVFEYIYFARPDSVIRDRLLYQARVAMGRELAREYPVEADLVIPIPDSATPAGVGFSQASGIPFSDGLMKNRYVGRTFIQPDQRLRQAGVGLKFNPMAKILGGQRVVVIDDSIVRGTTTPQVIKLLRQAGAREIHMRVCAPPIRHPCHFGVDMATRAELIAAQLDVPAIARAIGADSLGYLSLEGLMRAIDLPKQSFCNACFTGRYPIRIPGELDKLALEPAGVGERGPGGEGLPGRAPQ